MQSRRGSRRTPSSSSVRSSDFAGWRPRLFQRVEGLFWYGADGHAGLAQLVKRRGAPAEEVDATREELESALREAEAAVGSGPTSRYAVVSNTAVIVFREGLEAVLILAALVAGLVRRAAPAAPPALPRRRGSARRERRHLGRRPDRPRCAGPLRRAARGGGLARRDRRAAPRPELVLPPGLLERAPRRPARTQEADPGRGRGRCRRRASCSGSPRSGSRASTARASRRCSSFRRSCSRREPSTCSLGVALGLVGVACVGVLTITLGRKLPHRRLLVVTGAAHPGRARGHGRHDGADAPGRSAGFRCTRSRASSFPYWAGLWFGLFPTWEGLVAQATAARVVLGSYVAAEEVRKRRRQRRPAAAPARA